jgi:hypothetical protein
MFMAPPPPEYPTLDKISSPTELFQARYFGESTFEPSRIVQVQPFKRTVLLTHHRARAADFMQYQWLFKHGISEIWYEKPLQTSYELPQMIAREATADKFAPNPVALENPRVWCSAAFTTPLDDDIYDCTANHSRNSDLMGTCNQCTDEKSEALENTELVYYLVISTSNSTERIYGPPGQNGSIHGRQIYKLVKCGSREAAAVEAYFAAGCYGWNVVFSCVMRVGETSEDRAGKVEKVESLWNLAEERGGGVVRVFY